jgi:hypothetical protein
MNIYAGLFDSMLACCARTWLRHGPIYTIAMVALGLAVSLNILSVIDLLWIAGVLDNPYQSAGQLHPQRYILALLTVVFVANSLLARRHFSIDHFSRCDARTLAAPAYVLGSAALFLSTLTIDMMVA